MPASKGEMCNLLLKFVVLKSIISIVNIVSTVL